MRHLVLRLVEPAEIKFFPGQYIDIKVPGPTPPVRSRWPTPRAGRAGQLEFVIKVYPDGLFSHFLEPSSRSATGSTSAGRTACSRSVRATNDLVFVGGGAGMAPILSLLRSMAERGIGRKATYYYGARRRRDLCFEEELRGLEKSLPNFRYVPALSEPADGDDWDGESGLITDVVKRHETDLKNVHAYVCGPPPMVEAAMPLLGMLGVAREAHLLRQVHHDRGSRRKVRSNRGRQACCEPPGRDIGLNSQVRGDLMTTAPRNAASQAGLHRRRGRRQGVPGLERPPVQLLHPAEAQADPLRGRDRRGPARPAALPQPGLAVRVLRRPGRLPAGLDRPEGVGIGPARARALPRLRRQGL